MRFVIAGTFVSYPVGALYYTKLLDEIGADLICLPRFGLGSLAATTEHVIDLLASKEFDRPVDLVGHSQGGLIAVAVANRRPEFVGRVVAIGAPFAGAYLAPRWSLVPALRDMAPHSRFVNTLRATTEMLAISMQNDAVVRPYSSSALPAMPHIEVAGGHVSGPWSDELIHWTNQFLDNELHFDDDLHYLLEAA